MSYSTTLTPPLGTDPSRSILECPEAAAAIKAGDTVSVDFDTGVITDETTGQTFRGEPFPPFMQELIAAGGLAAYRRARA